MIIIPIVFLIVGVLVTFVLAPYVLVSMRARGGWIRTRAIVDSVQPKDEGNYVPHFTFTVDEKPYSGVGTIEAMSYKDRAGTEIVVVYDPKDPRRNDVASSFWTFGWIAVAAFGIIFIGCGVMGIVHPNGIVLFGTP